MVSLRGSAGPEKPSKGYAFEAGVKLMTVIVPDEPTVAALSAEVNVPTTEHKTNVLPSMRLIFAVAPELFPVTLSPITGATLPFGLKTSFGGCSLPEL